ncbi:MAG: ATP cone domain-containing protein, partial [Aigarchaeota archaeon]|nr:ATP cone domain-containing protein [Aigarchaeota archaeon]
MTKIRKRDGRVMDFDPQKITTAIGKAIDAVGGADGKLAKRLSDQVVEVINSKFSGQVPGVEDVQDAVEAVLIQSGHGDIAKAYILYRQKRTELREAKKFFVPEDELKLSLNATSV